MPKRFMRDHPQVAIYANNLGGVLESLGDLQGAKKLKICKVAQRMILMIDGDLYVMMIFIRRHLGIVAACG